MRCDNEVSGVRGQIYPGALVACLRLGAVGPVHSLVGSVHVEAVQVNKQPVRADAELGAVLNFLGAARFYKTSAV